MCWLLLIICCQLHQRSWRRVSNSSTPPLCTCMKCTAEICHQLLRILEGLRGVIDHYPLPEVPPLELRQKSFSAVVDFGFDLDTFPGSSVTFSSRTVVADSGSGLGLAGGDFDDSASETALSSSVSLSKDLASVLRELEDPRIVYTAFTNEGIFVEREEFVEENNRSSFVVGSVIVVDARLSGGAVVSDITNVITLMFEKTVEV